MTQYIIRRLLQAIPLLLLISIILFFLIQASGNPLATMGGRQPTREEDRERLAQRLGLNEEPYMQYLFWLIGDDWRARGQVQRDTAQGTLPVDTVHRWTFEGDAGQAIDISLSGRFAYRLDVLLPDDTGLASAEGQNLQNLMLPQDGVYTVSVCGAAGESNTDYRLVLVTEDGAGVPTEDQLQEPAFSALCSDAATVEDMGTTRIGETIYGERRGVLRGDFGKSLGTGYRPVVELIEKALPNTLILMLTAQFVIVVLSLVIGIISAVRQYSLLDNVLTFISYVNYSVPIFLMAYILVYIFAIKFRDWGLPHFPIDGMYELDEGRTVSQVLLHLVLPVASISLLSIAGYSRYIRSTMLEVIHSDYIRTARSKGLNERRILFLHAFKNASLPLVTLIGLDLPLLIGGAVVTETIFTWPGMGDLFITSVRNSDYPVMMAILLLISVAVVIFQLLTDIVYTWLDPRIRYS